jgi:hypothetical protein
MGWPDIHWLARNMGGLVAAMFEALVLHITDFKLVKSADEA